jgi:predicted Na+-dependent transporter
MVIAIELTILCIVCVCFILFSREKYVFLWLEFCFSLFMSGKDAEEFGQQHRNSTIFSCRYILPPLYIGFLTYAFAYKLELNDGLKLGFVLVSCVVTILFSWLVHREKL